MQSKMDLMQSLEVLIDGDKRALLSARQWTWDYFLLSLSRYKMEVARQEKAKKTKA